MMRAGHVVGRQTKTRNLERNLEQRRWEIKVVFFHLCSYPSNMLKSIPLRVLQEANTQQQVQVLGTMTMVKRILYCSSDIKKFNKAIELFLTLSRHLSCLGISWEQTCLCALPPTSSAGSSPWKAWPQCRQWQYFKAQQLGLPISYSLPSQI